MGFLSDWYVEWLEEQQKVSTAAYKKCMDLFSHSEVIDILKCCAQDIEDAERDPRTKKSRYPKEQTAEWRAAELLEAYKSEIDKYEETISKLIDLSYAQRMLLGLPDDTDENV